MWNGLRRSFFRSRATGPLAPFLAAPAPPLSTPVTELPLLALDLELTGLDRRCAEIVSVGFVPVDGLKIRLGGARKILVRPEGSVAESAKIHLIRDEDLEVGASLEEAMTAVLEALTGRALLVHFAGLDHGILARECRARYGAPLLVPIVDTLAVAHRQVLRSGREPPAGSLRLPALRAKFGLPPARLHGALSDAVATAELFLAMAAERGLRTRLRDYT